MKFIAYLAALLTTLGCATPDQQRFSPTGKTAPAAAQAKSIVFIHGMFMTPTSWQAWMAHFKNLGYQVHAPAWPEHEGPVEDQVKQHPRTALAKVRFDDVVEHYRKFVDALPEKPILIGHSMGGLVVQVLLQNGSGAAGVAIDSAPPLGVLSFRPSFARSNWKIISPFGDDNEPVHLSYDEFEYAFVNCLPTAEGKAIYQRYYVPESRLVGKGPLSEASNIAYHRKTQPLLFIAGEEDHIIPASLNYSNFKKYEDAPSATEFKMFAGRCHWTVGQKGWEDVANYVHRWLGQH